MKRILSSLTPGGGGVHNVVPIIALLSVFLLFSCLNPIGFNPDFKLSLDANITGQLDTQDVTSAVLMISNRSKTIDVTKVVITQPEVPDTYYEINGKPARLTNKAQYVKPSDKEYKVTINYNDTKNTGTGTAFALISTPLPRETYWLYIYRTAGGDIVIGKDVKDPDENDTAAPLPVDPNDPEAGEGSVPGVVPPHNRDRMGVLVVLNMTKAQDVDYVDFNTPVESASPNYKLYRMAGEPKRGDQQSIALGHASWQTKVAYTPAGGGQRFTGTKNAVVMPMNDPMSLRTNFMYFYKTKSGGYELSPIWPPVPNDADEEGNHSEEDMLGDNQGILRITNKSETGKVIKGILIGGTEHEVTMVKEDVLKFTLGAPSTVHVAFRPQGQSFYGLTIPRDIKPKKITDLAYYDNLGNPDDLPPAEGYGSGLLKIINNSTGVVTSANIVNPDNVYGIQMFKPSNSFTPPIPINYAQTGRVAIVGTSAFPLPEGKIFRIQVSVYTASGAERVVERNAVIRGQIVEIRINEKDLGPGESSYGAKVTIQNQISSAPGTATVGVTNMDVYNISAPSYSIAYGAGSFTPAGNLTNGNNATVSVTSTIGMPILNGAVYKARLTVESSNGKVALVEKDFSPDGLLYGDPLTNFKTVTITDGDVPSDLLVPFKPLTDITMPATSVASTVYTGTANLAAGGILNLDSVVTFDPADATNRTITWTTTSPTWVSINGSILTVIKGKLVSQGSQSVQVTATVPNGTAPGTAYSKTFTITLTYTETGSIGTNPVTELRWLWALDLGIGDTYDLRSRVIIITANGLPPAYNGRLVTHDDLVFSIDYATPGSMSLSEANNRKLTATAIGAGAIDVKLPAGVGAAGEIKASTPLTVTVRSKSVGSGLFGIFLNIYKVNNSNKNRLSDFNKATVVRYYHSGRPCPYGGVSGTFTTGKTGQTWDDQGGFTGVNKLVQKYAADSPALSVHSNGLENHHQASSQGIWGRWWTYTYGSTGPSQELCCDIWFVDKADNVYGYLENASIAPANNKILHLHLMGAGDPARPELWGLIWDVHVNTNVDSPQWGDVQILRHGEQAVQ